MCVAIGFEVHVAGAEFDVCLPCGKEQAQEVQSHTSGRCVYIAERNLVVCPMGQVLYPGNYTKTTKDVAFYNFMACKNCVCKCTRAGVRRFSIVMHEGVFSKVFDNTGLYVKQFRAKSDRSLVKLRKCLCEHPFGTLKRVMGMGYCLLRGVERVRGEFSLAFLAYNLKRAINLVGVSKLIQTIQT